MSAFRFRLLAAEVEDALKSELESFHRCLVGLCRMSGGDRSGEFG
jgi:hypothetical protein